MFIESVLDSGVRLMVPLLFAALGELISEKSGTINIGLEGMLAAGAYSAYVAMLAVGDPLLASMFAALCGMLVSSVMVVFCVWGRANQILVGFALFILVPGLVNFLYFQTGVITGTAPLTLYEIPLLSNFPVIGSPFFAQNGFYFALVLCAIATWWLLVKTRLGLTIAASGHDPFRARSKGIDVRRVRALSLLACGALAGIGGAALTLGATGAFGQEVVNGRGFIAIAIVILGRWSLGGTVLAALAIGIFDAMQLRLGQVTDFPVQLLAALPWIVVLVMLVAGMRLFSHMPRTLGRDISV